MKKRNAIFKPLVFSLVIILLLGIFVGCAEKPTDYVYTEFPLERNGISLHLDRMSDKNSNGNKNILLVHGLTYSSHEFDVDYKDYSFVRYLVKNGYDVWRVDIAGYGRSGEVSDGFIPDSDYASLDVCAATEEILKITESTKIDILGWSWGTVISSRFAYSHPEYINKLVLYAPILSGLGYADVDSPFHENDWEHAADDFQKDENGLFDFSKTEKEMIEMYCSSCWHYDGKSSPNGGRKDLCVDRSEKLIELDKITVPTLVIYGDSDPYINKELGKQCLTYLPDGSELKIIPGASHVMMYEKPYYEEFRNTIISFLKK